MEDKEGTKDEEGEKKEDDEASGGSSSGDDDSKSDSEAEKKKKEEEEAKKKEKEEAPRPRQLGKNQTDVAMQLRMLLKNGMVPNQQKGVVQTQRKQIQDDPEVIKTLGRNLRELKQIFDFYADKKSKRQFRWKTSALKLFDM